MIGDRAHLQRTYDQINDQIKSAAPHTILRDPATLNFIDIASPKAVTDGLTTGIGNASSGEVGFQTLKAAIAHTLSGKFDGIVTAPIAKSAWLAAGHHYPGQTELLAEMSGTQRFGMLFVAKSPYSQWTMRTLLATTHIPLKAVPTMLSPQVMTLKLELLIECLQRDFGLSHAKIAIAGLNPHSGEQGQLGQEEQDWLIPWIDEQQAAVSSHSARGAYPARYDVGSTRASMAYPPAPACSEPNSSRRLFSALP